MTATAVRSRSPSLLQLVLRAHWHRPDWVAAAVAAGGWVALLATTAREPAHAMGFQAAHGVADGIVHAAVMSAAMMGPTVLPQVHRVATSSRWRRRYRAVGGYLVGFLGAWTFVGVATLLVGASISSAIGWRWMLAATFGVSVLWVFAPTRRRTLTRCAATMPIALDGLRADIDCVRYGLRTARACITTCGPLSVAVMVDHGVVTMAVATAIVARERYRVIPAASTAANVGALGVLSLGLSF